MPMEEEPVIGAMYEDEDGLAFEVVSFDEDEGIIEVQYEDGEVSEIDIDSWYELDLQKLKSRAWKDDEEEEDEAEAPSPKRGKRAPIPEEDDDDIEEFDDTDDDGDDDSY